MVGELNVEALVQPVVSGYFQRNSCFDCAIIFDVGGQSGNVAKPDFFEDILGFKILKKLRLEGLFSLRILADNKWLIEASNASRHALSPFCT